MEYIKNFILLIPQCLEYTKYIFLLTQRCREYIKDTFLYTQQFTEYTKNMFYLSSACKEDIKSMFLINADYRHLIDYKLLYKGICQCKREKRSCGVDKVSFFLFHFLLSLLQKKQKI